MSNANLDAGPGNAVANTLKNIAENPTEAGVTAAAEALVEGEAAALNPLAGVAASAIAPHLIAGIVHGLFGLFGHLSIEVPRELAHAKDWLDKNTHGFF